jgi:hypothetical protein
LHLKSALRCTPPLRLALSAQAGRISLRPITSKECPVIVKSTLFKATLALAAGLTAASVQARDVTWSVGINAPLPTGVSIGTVISNGPVYHPAPLVYEMPVVLPPPLIMRPAPVVYVPQPVYVPQRVVYGPVWVPPGHGQARWKHKHHRHDRYRYRD